MADTIQTYDTPPYFVADSILPVNQFKILAAEQHRLHDSGVSRYWTMLSAGKSTAFIPSLADLPESQKLLTLITNPVFCERLKDTFQLPDVPIPLLNFLDTAGHAFFHKMVAPAYLSSHVDRSYLVDGNTTYAKVCNVIAYISPHWDSSFGGHTFLGKRNCKITVNYRPNRLLAFLHTSKSFHGVHPLSSFAPERYTVYMDYYLPSCCIGALNRSARLFWKHDTVYCFEPNNAITYLTHKHYLLDYITYKRRQYSLRSTF